MKFFTFLFLFGNLSMSAQSKAETEKWILDKLNETILEKTVSHQIKGDSYETPTRFFTYNNYSFSYDEYNFCISYDFIYVDYKNRRAVDRIHLQLPIYDFNKIEKEKSLIVNDYDDLEFTTIKAPGINVVDENNKVKSKQLSFSIRLSTLQNENLSERLNKAFINLKKYFTKPPQKKELF